MVLELGTSRVWRKTPATMHEITPNNTAIIRVQPKPKSLAKMSSKRLERLVTRLIQCTTTKKSDGVCKTRNGQGRSGQRPPWWPRELDFGQPLDQLKTKTQVKWTTLLRQLVEIFYKFCSGKPSHELQWISKKPKEVTNDENTPKRRRIECLRRLKHRRDSWKSVIDEPLSPVVRLRDILKVPSQEEFMSKLGLQSCGVSSNSDGESFVRPKPASTRLSQIPTVPFSSDYARVLIAREKLNLDQTHQRRIERVEWYLKDQAPPRESTPTFPITYEPKSVQDLHTFKFPKRQYYQDSNFVNCVEFLKTLCKPVSVVLERLPEEKQPVSVKPKTDNTKTIRSRAIQKSALVQKNKIVKNAKVVLRKLHIRKDPLTNTMYPVMRKLREKNVNPLVLSTK